MTFSKSILRRFIRDCVDRAATAAAPWIVKGTIGDKYGVDPTDPQAAKKNKEVKKTTETEKRKRNGSDKEGPPTKKQKKLDERGMQALFYD